MNKITVNDAPKLEKIRKTCFSDYWSEKSFIDMLSDKSFFGFSEEHGFILCRKAYDTMDIVTFCVESEYRNQGIGTNLLFAVINFAKENSSDIFLEVAEKNFPAIHLYKSLEFKKISIRKNYYKFSDGLQNAIVMKYEAEGFNSD